MSTYDLVLHVDKTDGALRIALNNAINYANALPNETYKMVLVVNSHAVTQLRADDNAELVEPFEKAVSLGLDVRVCQNALNATGTDPKELFAQCSVVPAGIVEIVKLQRAGFAYIKP